MGEEIHFIDTTFRDGSQSLWAMGIRYGMMEPIAADMDRAGFSAIEVIANGIFFKKIVRDLKEDPWQTQRMLAEKMPRTFKTCMSALNLSLLGTSVPWVVQDLAYRMLADLVKPYRVQIVCNTADQLTRTLPKEIPLLRSYGFKVALALSYTISPRHTTELFAEQARRAVAPRSTPCAERGRRGGTCRATPLLPRCSPSPPSIEPSATCGSSGAATPTWARRGQPARTRRRGPDKLLAAWPPEARP